MIPPGLGRAVGRLLYRGREALEQVGIGGTRFPPPVTPGLDPGVHGLPGQARQ